MKRRNFFATLFAPLIARWLPKPKSIADIVNEGLNPAWDGMISPGTILDAVDVHRKLLLLHLAQHHYISYECVVGTGWVTQTDYWHKDHAPFVVMPPIECPWETCKNAS